MQSMASRGLRNGTARMPAPQRPRISPLSLRRVPQPHAPRATSGAPEPEEKTAFGKKVDKVIEELKKTGMTTSKAKEVLKTWSDIGVQDPEQLKKVLMKKSLAPIPAIAAQLLLDGVASYGGFYLGQLASDAENFPFRIGVEILGYFFGLYYFVQTLLDAGVIGGLLFTTYRYGTNSASLLTAIQAMAGPAPGLSGLSIADRATQVVNILKVVAALEQVASILKEEYKETPKDNSLRNLGAYLTLAQAREKLGFKPETYGLSEKEAGNIAYAFATYDTNQNYKLEANELGALCESLGSSLTNDETKEALNILDVNKDGYISFNEFVAWWVKKAPSPPPEDRK